MTMAKKKLLILIGPTAVGKTALSIQIAKRFDLEIISGDSMQIYKHMDIGTGKITEEEKEGVLHHMLDIVEPDEDYSVKAYQDQVTSLINSAHDHEKLPFIVGGTGLYIKSLIYESYQFNDENEAEKKRLIEHYETFTNEILYEQLIDKNNEYAETIHPNNRRRMIRTLIRHDLGDFFNKSTYNNLPKYDIFIIGLHRERERLYERINMRVRGMFDEGLLEEVHHLTTNFSLSKTAHAAIGYKEFDGYFNGELTLEDVIEQIQQNSRRYAKRQLTFFRNQLPVTWYDVDKDSIETIMEDIQQFINR